MARKSEFLEDLGEDLALHLGQHLHRIEDPRQADRIWHKLLDILVIILCALLCGAESFVEIEKFGISKRKWLEKFLELPGGIPSHDTFLRVLSILNLEQMEQVLAEWAKTLVEKYPQTISIDGKSIRGTSKEFNQKGARPAHEINVYDSGNSIVLGQFYASGSGSTEVRSVLEALRWIDLKQGASVSLDAAGAHFEISNEIREKGGHYVFPIKKNNPSSWQELDELFKKIPENPEENEENSLNCSIDFSTFEQKSHGRYEKRACTVISAEKASEKFHRDWKDVASLVRIHRVRQIRDKRYYIYVPQEDGRKQGMINPQKIKRQEETVYYISSQKGTSEKFLQRIQQHWAIENQLHWILDVAFHEDDWRVKEKTVAHNLAVIRKIALNLISKEPTKEGPRVKMKRASWDNEYLEKVVFGISPFSQKNTAPSPSETPAV